jgi:hypothetical protein
VTIANGSNSLTADLAAALPSKTFIANAPAVVTISSGPDQGIYAILNNATAGYQASTDNVIKLNTALIAADFIQ